MRRRVRGRSVCRTSRHLWPGGCSAVSTGSNRNLPILPHLLFPPFRHSAELSSSTGRGQKSKMDVYRSETNHDFCLPLAHRLSRATWPGESNSTSRRGSWKTNRHADGQTRSYIVGGKSEFEEHCSRRVDVCVAIEILTSSSRRIVGYRRRRYGSSLRGEIARCRWVMIYIIYSGASGRREPALYT